MQTRGLRCGILGLGRGSSGMIVALVRHPAAQITAAADLRREPLERFARDFEAETFRCRLAPALPKNIDTAGEFGLAAGGTMRRRPTMPGETAPYSLTEFASSIEY